MRARYPQLARASNDQIRMLVMKRKAQSWMEQQRAQAGQNAQLGTQTIGPSMPPQSSNAAASQNPQTQAANSSLTAQDQINKLSSMQTANATQQPKNAATATATATQTAPLSKGGKRSADDVVEVPNPGTAPARKAQPAPTKAVQQKAPGPQPPPPMAQALQQTGQAEKQTQANQTPQQTSTGNNIVQPDQGRMILLRKLKDEVARSMPTRAPFPLDTETKAKMAKILSEQRQYLQRADTVAITYLMVGTNNEHLVRDLIAAVSFETIYAVTVLISITAIDACNTIQRHQGRYRKGRVHIDAHSA